MLDTFLQKFGYHAAPDKSTEESKGAMRVWLEAELQSQFGKAKRSRSASRPGPFQPISDEKEATEAIAEANRMQAEIKAALEAKIAADEQYIMF